MDFIGKFIGRNRGSVLDNDLNPNFDRNDWLRGNMPEMVDWAGKCPKGINIGAGIDPYTNVRHRE